MKKEINKILAFYKKTFPNLPSQAFTLVYFTYITYLNITVFIDLVSILNTCISLPLIKPVIPLYRLFYILWLFSLTSSLLFQYPPKTT